MKIKILGSFVLAAVAFSSFGQTIENDDMYFNAKDRAKLKQAREVAYAKAETVRKKDTQEEYVNPTDSYSARNVNPEYSARSNAEIAQSDNEDYFINNYQYQTTNNLRRFNNNWNNWYSDSWYNSNYWSPSISSWNSPYYGGFYSMYGNPWNNPYYQSAWSSSFSYHWGNTWNYGWNGYSAWNYPFYGNSWAYSPYAGYGWGYNSWYGGYPRNIIVVTPNGYSEGGRTITYGKRPSRSSSEIPDNYNTRSRTFSTNDASGGRTNSGGRTSSRDEYYNKSWRYTSPTNTGTSRTYSNGSGNDRTTNSSYNPGRSSYGGNNNSSYSGGSSGNSGASRSSTPPPSSGSNGRSRGSR